MNESQSTLSNSAALHSPTHEEISRRAEEIWEQQGRPAGRDEEIWLEAERTLSASAPAAPRASGNSADPVTQPADPAPRMNAPASNARASSKATATPRMPSVRGTRAAGK